MVIAAVACDGIPECHTGVDEHWVCENSSLIWYVTVSFLIVILVITIILKLYFSPQNNNEENVAVNEVSENVLDKNYFMTNHNDVEFPPKLNIELMKNYYLNEENTRIQTNEAFYDLELEYHGGDKAETALCMKNRVCTSICKVVMEDKFPGIIRTYCPGVEKLEEKIEKTSWTRWLLHKVKVVALIYLDLVKDTYLGTTILILSGVSALIYFTRSLSSVVVFCIFGSILIPMALSSLILARRSLDMSQKPVWRKVFIYAKVILLSPIQPLILINAYDHNKTSRKDLIKTGQYHKALMLIKEGEKIKNDYVKYIRMDLGLETFYQLKGQILLVLLAITETATTKGLKKMFEKTNVFLYISIFWSVKTLWFVHLKSVTVEKPFCPIKAKALVFLWGVFSSIKRILVVVMFFVPGFGLFSLLYHWRAEQIPFISDGDSNDVKNLTQFDSNGDKIYLYNSTPVAWSLIDRWNYSDQASPSPPPYTLYTGYSLGEYFTMFWIITGLHSFCLVLTKLATSENFRRTSCVLEMFVHAVENINLPCPWRDWDQDGGTVTDHVTRHKSVNIEMVATMAVNLVFNIVMLVPVFSTASKIKDRHIILGQSIGVRSEETISYDNSVTLVTSLSVIFPLLSVLELLTYLLYNNLVMNNIMFIMLMICYSSTPGWRLLEEETNLRLERELQDPAPALWVLANILRTG